MTTTNNSLALFNTPQTAGLAPPKKKKVLEADDVLDPIAASEDLDPVAYRVTGSASFAIRGVAYDGGEPAQQLAGVMLAFAGALEEWPAFVRELFGRMYDAENCERLPPEQISTWGATAVGAAEGQADWSSLCASAHVSRSVAAKATVTIAVAVAEALDLKKDQEPNAATADPRAALAEAEAEAEAIEAEAEEAAAEMRSQGADPAVVDASLQVAAQQAAAVRLAAQKATSASVAARKAIDARFKNTRHQLVRAVAQAAKEAAQAAALAKASEVLGFDREGPGSIGVVAPDLAQQLKVDARLLKIILQAGRNVEAAKGAKAIGEGNVEVVGVKPTGDLARTTPAWKTRLALGGVSATLATVDLLEGQANGYELRDRAPREKGDVGILVDRSGSMTGEPEIAARALALAAFLAALKDKRRVVAGSFAGRGDVVLASVTNLDDHKAVVAALRALCQQAGGGTDVDGAVVAAAKAMQSFPGGMRSPDVVVITDGIFDPVAASVLKALGDRRLFGVFIGFPANGHPEFHRAWSVDNVGLAFAAGVIATMREGRQGKR